ncbi:MAG: hypothetical protein A3G18_01715 [Rhodospirillales bacterium RIFCSPLOWO2_12_FULL_58_28]|nr:MAG: hypothetical protein A3H92_07800 [Rhodospirillales bacterium RIFCSPLOWO2_02_FULL_58_16]OHC79014.1 MAG: hypothetical protein A3G18_01715 [Rhodospirillales bacterium RIFCSPLOWO2_12_FULL_58_28]
MQTQILHISGMRCEACVTLVKREMLNIPGVSHAKVSLKHRNIEIGGEIANNPPQAVIHALEPCLKKYGYDISLKKPRHVVAWREFLVAAPVALVFLALYVWLQKLGIVSLVNTDGINYAVAFIIGLIASVSTCMVIVGGLTLSVSANFAKEGDKTTPQLLFHGGRLVSFFALGGIIGALGVQFELGQTGMLTLTIAVGVVMLALGINLLDIFPVVKSLQPTLPQFISRHLLEFRRLNHTLTPALLGAITFFLPCSFTQSMQFYALSAGGFMKGGLTMLIFALGTLPVLALLSFSALGIHSPKASGIFFKTSGLVVIAFAVVNLMNAMVIAGLINPVMSI